MVNFNRKFDKMDFDQILNYIVKKIFFIFI